ncbi:MAG: asparagine synthetase B family protein, partial [bacterium]
VYCLMPAHYLWYKDGKVETHRYWEPKFSEDPGMTREQAVEEIEKVFEDSVSAHKISDVEVGCFLSSGVDSSYVSTYFAGQKTFTVGFDYGEKYNEIDWAKNLSEKIGVEHHYKVISADEYWGNIRKVQYHMDQPLADASCIALYFVSKMASEYVKVVLSGEGADELFGGYNIYHEPDDFAGYKKLPLGLRKALAAVAKALPFSFRGKSFLMRGALPIEENFIGNCSMFTMDEKRRLLKSDIPVTRPQELTKPYYDRVKDKDDVTKMQYLDINVWLVGDILLKADRMSMANSLELRVPFLDKEVFGVASRIPRKLRVNKENTKYAMRLAAMKHLPDATAQKKKLGFPVPTRVWLRDEKYYNVVKDAFTGETAKQFFNTDELMKFLDDHYSGKRDNNRKIWTIFVFLVWYDIYFNGGSHEPGDLPVIR